jgi:hypothetical protein
MRYRSESVLRGRDTVVAFKWFRYVEIALGETVIEQWLSFETTTPRLHVELVMKYRVRYDDGIKISEGRDYHEYHHGGYRSDNTFSYKLNSLISFRSPSVKRTSGGRTHTLFSPLEL